MNEKLQEYAEIFKNITEDYTMKKISRKEYQIRMSVAIDSIITEYDNSYMCNFIEALHNLIAVRHPDDITLEQILPFFVLAINNYYKDTKNQEPYLTDYIANMDPYIRDMGDSLYLKYFDGERLSAALSIGEEE